LPEAASIYALVPILISISSIFALTSIPIQMGYSQAQSNETTSFIQTLTSQNVTNNVAGYTELNGNHLSFKYPKEWTVNKFLPSEYGITAEAELYFMSDDPEKNAIIQFGFIRLNQSEIVALGLVQNNTDNLDSNLSQTFPRILEGIKSSIVLGVPSEEEEPVYNKYTVAGHKAGSVLYNANYQELTVRVLVIGTVIHNNIFMLAYSAPFYAFDENLPIVENVLNSIKLREKSDIINANETRIEDINLNGIWQRADKEELIITQQASSVVASFPGGRGTCEEYGLIGRQFETEFDFRGVIEGGKVLAEKALCYTSSTNQSEIGLFLDKANFTINKDGTTLEGFVQNRFGTGYKHDRFDKVDEIQPIDLNLEADREKYESGQVVHLTGILSDVLPLTNQTVLLQIFDPIGQGYDSQDIIINPDNSFAYDLNIKNASRKGTFKIIATYAGFGDTVNFEYGVPRVSMPVFFQAPVLNNTNITTIEGTPTAISLFYNDGELPSANNVTYKVKFEIPNEKFRILKFGKGTFDNVQQISKDTLIFKTPKILKNENKTGIVVLALDNNSTKNPKLILYADVTVNGTTQKTTIDPGLSGIISLSTSILKLANEGFELGLNVYNEAKSGISIEVKNLSDFTSPERSIEIVSSSKHPQITNLSTSGLPTFIRPLFNPLRFEIEANETKNSILTLQVMNNTVSKKQDIPFTIFADVLVYIPLLNVNNKVAFSETQSSFTLEPVQQVQEPVQEAQPVPVKIDCSSKGNSANSPELFQNIQPLSINNVSLKNETALDNLGTHDINFMQICVIGYDKISKTRYPIDIVFSIDSSPSMEENDKDNLRISAAKSLIDRLDSNTDKAGFIAWGREIALQRSLTSDFPTLKANFDEIELVGGTNLDSGLRGGVELLEEDTGLLEKYTNAKTNQEQNRTKVILFLSDGNGYYTRSTEPGSLTGVAKAKGYKIFTVGLNINNATAENDLKDIAGATGGAYYPSTVAENLNDIYNKIFENIVTKEFPKDMDLIVTLPKEGIKPTGFNIEPAEINDGNKSMTWKNVSQHAGNKDNFLSRDENVIITFNIEGLSSNDIPVGTLNYIDTDGINRSLPSELEVDSISKPPLS
jgi:Mg-chelatase subunit ChlD